MELDIETIGYILENKSDECIEEMLTPDDCLRYMAHQMGKPVNELRKRYRNIKEGLPTD